MTEDSIFSGETRVIEQAERIANNDHFSGNPLLEPYLNLLKEYKKLFRQTKRLVKMSDRMQQSLNELNEELQSHKEILARMSYVDGLTSIANRRRFDEFMEAEWKRNLREELPLAVILLDLDYFKQFNDNYGHSAGDKCLIQVAQALSDSVKRPGDLVARFGGEEFIALLPGTGFSGGMQVAAEIQENIHNLAIPHEYSNIAQIVTVSIGLAVMIPEAKSTPQKLIHEADKQLYTAKHAGRNQIKGKVVNNDASNPNIL